MVMIETRNREPARTFDDLRLVFSEAAVKVMVPFRLEIGFFQMRDLLDLHAPGWRKSREYHSLLHLHGIECRVTQLEDRVVLHCRDAEGTMLTKFEVDRRGE